MKDFDEYLRLRIGGRIDWDRVFNYQCADLLPDYLYEVYGRTGIITQNAIDYWRKPSDKLRQVVDFIETSQAQKGDGVILKTKGYTGHPANDPGDGHFGIATGVSNNTQIEILEQNGSTGNGSGTGGDAIRTRFVDRSRVAGLLRPILITIPAVTYAVSYINTTARDLLTTKNPTNWYELTGEFSPLTTLPEGTRVPVAGIAHWSSSTGETHDFYMTPEDFGDAGRTQVPNKNNGISTDDLKEVPPPTPYKAPEVLYNIQDKMAEKYTLVTDLLCFPTAGNAASYTTPNGELKKDVYYVHGRDREMINLSKGNMDRDVKQWINPRKNVVAAEEPKPVPAPVAVPEKIIEAITVAAEKIPEPVIQKLDDGTWKVTKSLRPDGKPVHFRFMNTQPIQVFDLEGKLPPIDVLPYNNGVSGAFTQEFWKENERGELVHYLRAEKIAKNFWFYGVPLGYLDRIDDVPLDYNNDGKRDISDIVELGQNFIDYGQSVIHKIGAYDKAVHLGARTKQFTKGVVDGFTRRTKK